MEYGIYGLIPTLVVIILALWTHRTVECLIAGVIVGLFMVAPLQPLALMAEISLEVMMNETVAWIILVCGFMGSLIALFIRTGAVSAFTEMVITRVSSRKGGLLTAWVLGIFLFVDDYLNSIAVGAAMRKVTDSFGTSREMLAYVVDSTAAPVSVVIPISTWAVFFGALLVDNGVAPEGQGVQFYISAIPYMFYAWAAIAIVPLVIAGVIPVFGPMRKAEERAARGQTVPPGAAHIEAANQAIHPKPGVRSSSAEFLVPMAVLAVSTWYFDYDFLMGIYLTLTLYILMIVVRRTLTMDETYNAVLEGFKSMLEPLAALVAAYLLDAINGRMGLSEFVIEALSPHMTAEMLPLAIFLTMGTLSFATGSNWGVFIIVLPIVVTMANALDANMAIVIGASLSASTFGSHACFYTDATVLTAQACGTTPFQHAWTQLPYALIAAAIAAVGYLLVV
ncbi:MAG TPA: Na+/H+ antiporter NhaC family protein [Xanthomonadales bacterium]|nr:Na+/H+ antiporter NhaC family protein [Xanthomonadales bacterium]